LAVHGRRLNSSDDSLLSDNRLRGNNCLRGRLVGDYCFISDDGGVNARSGLVCYDRARGRLVGYDRA
jgi:hypothetical protein